MSRRLLVQYPVDHSSGLDRYANTVLISLNNRDSLRPRSADVSTLSWHVYRSEDHGGPPKVPGPIRPVRSDSQREPHSSEPYVFDISLANVVVHPDTSLHDISKSHDLEAKSHSN